MISTLASAADLELHLDHTADGRYTASTSLRMPESDAPSGISGVPVQIDLAELRSHQMDDAAYGRALARMLFDSRRLSEAFIKAHAAARAQDLPLRLRLHLDPHDDTLHALRWELLCDTDGIHLGLSEQVLLSRFVVSTDSSPYKPKPRRVLRALVAAAAPANLAQFRLTPFDASGVAVATTAALKPAHVTTLDSGAKPVSLARLAESLRDAPDLFCLVCHGALTNGEPVLFLEHTQGLADPVTASRLLEMLGALDALPRLVVLLACEGAGDGCYAALSALGPRLARAGVPAVLAMQGKVGLSAALDFVASMMREIQRDGQIDRAVAAARAAVRATPHWWRPALFMRLISGQLWIPDAAEEPASFDTAPPFPLPDLFPPAESLIGRGSDLVELCNLFEQARQGRKGQVAIITGRPGYGRAALARAVGAYAEERGAAQLALRFWPTARLGEPQRAALWAEDHLLTPEVAALESQIAAAWPASAALAGPAWVRLAAQVAALLGHLPAQMKDNPRALLDPMRTVARQCPLVLRIEGLDLAPDPWPDLLRYLLPELRRDWPALLLLTADAEAEPATLPDDHRGETLAWTLDLAGHGIADLRWLEPVSVADVADHIAPAAPGIARRLHELGDGCPTLIEAIWAEWQEQGTVRWDDQAEQWQADPNAPQVYGRLRDRAHNWLGALLPPNAPADFTEETATSILSCAALEGRAFTAQAVAAALGLDAEAVLDLCDSLIGDEERPGLLDEVGFVPVLGRKPSECPNVYRFSYLYLWLVWRDYGPEGDARRTLQACLAEALEKTYDPEMDLVAGAIIQLYEAAGLLQKAEPYRKRASRTDSIAMLRFQVELLAALEEPGPMDGFRLYELRTELSWRIHRETGRYDEALSIDLAALQQTLEWGDREREAQSRHNVGVRYSFLEQHTSALYELKQALEISKAVLGMRHPSTASTLHALGQVRQDQGDYPTAEDYYQHALEIKKAVLGMRHPETASTLHALGQVRQNQGDYPTAEDYYQQALEISKAVLGMRHPETANTLLALGWLRRDQGDYPTAEDYYQQALEIFKAVLGMRHPETASTLHALGQVRQDQGDYPTAEDYYQHALEIKKAVLGMRHPETASTLRALGWLRQAQGDYFTAESYLQQALAIWQLALGAHHPYTAFTMYQLGVVYEAQSNYSAAEDCFQQALGVQLTTLGSNHPDTQDTQRSIRELEQKTRRQATEEAEPSA